MQDTTYKRFAQLIQQSSGIALGDDKQLLLQGRIRHRVKSLGLKSTEQYFSAVQHDSSGRELMQLLDSIATNHTFFFREHEHIDVFLDLLRERLAEGQRRFRIWCAAASTGEEPYSLAMSALHLFDEMTVAVDFKLLATDLSSKALAVAQHGWYSTERCGNVPTTLSDKFLERVRHEQQWGFQIGPRLREAVTLRRLNLVESPYPMRGPIDVIFCRNVMIYFDEPTRRSIVKQCWRLLPSHGLLFVGMTESLLGMNDGYDYYSPSVYRRTGHAETVMNSVG